MATATAVRPPIPATQGHARLAAGITAGVAGSRARRDRRRDDGRVETLQELAVATSLKPAPSVGDTDDTPDDDDGRGGGDDSLSDDLSVEALYRRDLMRYDVLSQAEVDALYVRMRRGGRDGQAAREAMICANLRLVITIARSYASATHAPLGDVIAEGNIGLMRAVDRYKPELGFSFGTYAGWWIRQAMTRQACNDALIRLPEHVRQARNTVRRTRRRLSVELGHEPSDAELQLAAGDLRNGVSYATVAALPPTPASLDRMMLPRNPRSRGNDPTLADTLPDPDPTPEELVVDRAAERDVVALLGTVLTKREAQVIRLRFGLAGCSGGEHTLLETGKQLRISRERVRQLEVRALEKLRAVLGADGMATLAS